MVGIDEVKMLVVVIDGKYEIIELVKYVYVMYLYVYIIVCVVDCSYVYDLWVVGCCDIIREIYDSLLRMSCLVVEVLGYSWD